jgi:hypothetical protein
VRKLLKYREVLIHGINVIPSRTCVIDRKVNRNTKLQTSNLLVYELKVDVLIPLRQVENEEEMNCQH